METNNIIKEAYKFAKERHKGQKKINGKDYFEHPKNMYKILLKRKKDYITLCGALLHDTVEDTNTSLDEIKKRFGNKIAFVVDGMTKIKPFEKYLKKFEKYVKKDRRILMIKMADLEDNLSVFGYVKEYEKVRIKEIYLGFINLIEKLSNTKEEKDWIRKISKETTMKSLRNIIILRKVYIKKGMI